MVTFDDFVFLEFQQYKKTMTLEGLDPLEFDDWFKGSDYLKELYKITVYTAWPFPTSLVNKPLNDVPAKIDGLKDAQEAPL